MRLGMSMALPRMAWAIQGAKLGNYVPIPVFLIASESWIEGARTGNIETSTDSILNRYARVRA